MTTSANSAFDTINVFAQWDHDYYPPLAQWYYDRAVADMLCLLNVQPGDRVLDAGCGPGVHSIRVARAGAQVLAIDISPTALDEARRRANQAGVADKVAFEEADLTRLPYPDGSFDHVFSWGVVIHIPNIEAALNELARILAPGGRLALYVTNHRAWDYPLLDLARWLRGRKTPALTRDAIGRSQEFDTDAGRLWVWQVDVAGLTRHLETHGLAKVARRPGNLSELQRRFRGRLRNSLLRMNNLWYRFRLPAGPCVTNLLIFEKPAS